MMTDRELDQVLRGVSLMEIEAARPERGEPPLRPTPQMTVEAVMVMVREQGLAGLKEPGTLDRLLRCDDAARAQIDDRIDKLIEAGRLPKVGADA